MGAEVAEVAGRVMAGAAAEGAGGFVDRLVEEDDAVPDVEEDVDDDDFASAFCFFWWLKISYAVRTCMAFHLPVF